MDDNYLKNILEDKAVEYIAKLYEISIQDVESLLELEIDEVEDEMLYNMVVSSFNDYMEGVENTLSLLNIEFDEDED